MFVLGLGSTLNVKVAQLDIKISFLHGDLKEYVYVK